MNHPAFVRRVLALVLTAAVAVAGFLVVTANDVVVKDLVVDASFTGPWQSAKFGIFMLLQLNHLLR